ncbi:pilus assembly protein N-terminal domain-containing protein [Mariniblastus fucicola]|nr:pilus assembly protein N-terminal domain-containing protein [Mariniblastus fucicola]
MSEQPPIVRLSNSPQIQDLYANELRAMLRGDTECDLWADIKSNAYLKRARHYPAPRNFETGMASDGILLSSHIPISIESSATRLIDFGKGVPSVLVEDPAIVDVVPVTSSKLQFVAKSPGTTTVTIGFNGESPETILATVVAEKSALQKAFTKRFPQTKVNLRETDGEVMLLGDEPDKAAARKMIRFVEKNSKLDVNTTKFCRQPIVYKIRCYEISMRKFREQGIHVPDSPGEKYALPSKFFLNENDILAARNNGIGIGIRSGDASEKTMAVLAASGVAQLTDAPIIVANVEQKAEFSHGVEFPPKHPRNGRKPFKIGNSINVSAHKVKDDSFVMEVHAEFSVSDLALSGFSETSGFQVHRINTGLRMKFGQSLLLVHEPSREVPDGKAILTLITPNNPPSK